MKKANSTHLNFIIKVTHLEHCFYLIFIHGCSASQNIFVILYIYVTLNTKEESCSEA